MTAFSKWLVAVLILANAGLWLWATGFRPGTIGSTEYARPEIRPEHVQLLSEPGVRLQPRLPEAPVSAELTNTATGGCHRLGPFATDAEVERAVDRVKLLSLVSERRAEERTVVTGYRVYLPPLSTRDAAEKKRRELSRLGFKDSSVMQEVGMENALSLGLFTVEANAQKHVRALAAKKIEARIQALSRAHTFQWLHLSPTASVADALPQLRLAEWGNSDIRLEETACVPPAT